jgi:pSer/pThr/pTyr-binding forkhead associated (FHA) protein
MFKLVIQDDEGKTTVVPLIRDEITIGRKEGNTIRLTERNVSRRHARIVRSNGAVAIEDLGSYNGVRVNGTRIAQRTALTISDRVQIGDYLIELKAEGAEVGAPSDDGKTQPIERIDPAMLAATVPTPNLAAQAAAAALADTDPNQQAMRAAAAAVPAAPPPVPMSHASGNARVVVLSSNFAGQEFDLSKPQMIIGRTDDNDIVVNHRSISRNHAKIVREPETGRYTISDLQSSNGVRVNGEEYGKVELRRGDMIDLGHVRLRFVEAGEDFLFGRDAQAVDMPGGGSKKGLIAAIGAVVVIGVVVVAVTAGGGSKDGSEAGSGSAVAAADTGSGTGSAAAAGVAAGSDHGTGPGTGQASGAAPAVADTGSGAAVGSDDPAAKVAQKKAECVGLRDKEDWAGLAGCSTDLGKLDPGDDQAHQLADQARKEMANSLVFTDLKAAAGKRDYAQVKELFEKLDEDSVYKDRGRTTHDKLRDEFIAKMVDRAKGYAAQHKCADVAKLAEQAGKIWPEAKDAVDNVACREVVAVTHHDTHKPDNHTHKPDNHTTAGGHKPDNHTAAATVNAAQSLDDARAAAKNGQWGKALRLCEEVTRTDRSNQEATTICALAACNLKSKSKAKTYIGRLSASRAGLARQSCLRNGVDVQ